MPDSKTNTSETQPGKDTRGKVISALAIALDATTRKAMEQSLHTNEARLNEAQRIARHASHEIIALGVRVVAHQVGPVHQRKHKE